MSTPITVEIPHQLGRAEARRRIEKGFAKLGEQLPGGSEHVDERWDGDRLSFGMTTMGQSVSGVVDVLDTVVTIRIDLPGVLGIVGRAVSGRLAKAGRKLLGSG